VGAHRADCSTAEVYDPRSIRWRNTLSFKRTVVLVAVLNLSYFGIEFITARRISSVSLLADSIDFLEDASVNLLIVAALGMTLIRRARVGMVLAGILLIPAGVTLWTAGEKLRDPVAPDTLQLSLVGLGALVVNLTCALLLVRFRAKHDSLGPSRIPLRPQRRHRQHRDHRCRPGHRLPHPIGMARSHRRTRDRCTKRRRGTRGVHRG